MSFQRILIEKNFKINQHRLNHFIWSFLYSILISYVRIVYSKLDIMKIFSTIRLFIFHGILVRAFDSIRFDWNHLASFLFYQFLCRVLPLKSSHFIVFDHFFCSSYVYVFEYIILYELDQKKTKKSSTNQYVCVLYIVFNVFVCLYSYLYIRTVYVYVSRVIFLFRCVC